MSQRLQRGSSAGCAASPHSSKRSPSHPLPPPRRQKAESPAARKNGPRDHAALTDTVPLLAAALKKEAGIKDGRLRGAYKDDADGHGTCPWRSGIRRDGFEHVTNKRHASRAEASLRILEVYQGHPAYVESDCFVLAAGRHVNAEQLARLVDAARADAGR